MRKVYNRILNNHKSGKKSFAVLIDPDEVTGIDHVTDLVQECANNDVDLILVGGSLLTTDNLNLVVRVAREASKIPVVLFPGHSSHIDHNADAILFLSLISGRNPEFLIGQQVLAAPVLKDSDVEVLPTGYMLIESGNHTTVAYISDTHPIPRDKFQIAAATALAGEMLGMKMIYLDGGSGAKLPVDTAMITEVRKNIRLPLIVGGGIRSPEAALNALKAGADIIVVGNGIEETPEILESISKGIRDYNRSLNIHQ